MVRETCTVVNEINILKGNKNYGCILETVSQIRSGWIVFEKMSNVMKNTKLPLRLKSNHICNQYVLHAVTISSYHRKAYKNNRLHKRKVYSRSDMISEEQLNGYTARLRKLYGCEQMV